MAVNTTPPTDAEIKKWFLDADDLPQGTFEFALVLGGTVSAGAYTAGAVDFLIQALDCLSRSQAEQSIPKHDVRLKIIAGTSGGGVNAAVIGRALNYRYPHPTLSAPFSPAAATGNPFYDTWVRGLHLDGFLGVGGTVDSLLDGKPIEDGAAAIVSFGKGEPASRAWVAAPLRLILTVTSLRGIPYKTNFGADLGQGYVDHADYARFALLYPGQTMGEARPDEFVLGFGQPGAAESINWQSFSEYAMATAAFPLGFPPRTLRRPIEHYRWRVVPYPPEPGGDNQYKLVLPDWDAMGGAAMPEMWEFLAVDGGATDNEPIQLARSALSGLLKHSPRKADTANRAVWLIDPFAGRAPLGPTAAVPFASEIGSVITTLTQQTRYDTADLLMAADDTQYSRFMLTPRRGDLLGEDAIASGGLGAFIGFACTDFMHHDFMLGRRNCWRFLKDVFNLAPENKLFVNWKDEQKAPFLADTPQGRMMPIIPLTSEAAVDPGEPEWPAGKLKPETYRDAIEARFRKVLEAELSGSTFRTILGFIGAHAAQGAVGDAVVGAMKAYLAKAKL